RGLKEDGKDWNEVDVDLDWVKVTGIPSYHDKEEGKQRGKNTIFLIEMEGMRIVHLGDLGHPLTDEQVAKLWPTDVLLAPVGGHFTIEPEEVPKIAGRIEPKILIPMHYKTEYTEKLPIKPLDDFLKGKKNVKELKGYEYTIFSSTLPKEMTIVVFKIKDKPKK
ncbi:MAG: MBL fold metallo-hydrolase, partial [bacterium]